MTRSALALLGGLSACATQPHVPQERAANACDAAAFPDRAMVLDVDMQGTARRGLVWMPPGAGPHDVVVLLHEFRSEPERTAYYTGWRDLALREGIILVAPDGKSSTWNAGGCCGASADRKIDDVAFLDAVVRRIDDVACTTGRVLATGIGAGAKMAQHWACMSAVPDAVISVGGALQADTCEATRPIPVLHFHGADDDFLPASGKAGIIGFTTVPLDKAMEPWYRRNQSGPPTPRTSGQLRCDEREGASPVTVCMVDGLEDVWPGAVDGAVTSELPLRHAANDGLAWVRQRWPADAAR